MSDYKIVDVNEMSPGPIKHSKLPDNWYSKLPDNWYNEAFSIYTFNPLYFTIF